MKRLTIFLIFFVSVWLLQPAQAADNGPWVTNLTDTSVTISWVTEHETTGQVEYGTTDTSQVAYDQRGQAVSSQTHSVILSGLTPETSYQFDIVSDGVRDDHGGAHYQFTTGSTLAIPLPDPIYGPVYQEDGSSPAEGVLLLYRVVGTNGTSGWLSALTEASGYWSGELSGLRTADGSAAFNYTANDELAFQIYGGDLGQVKQTVPINPHAPVPAFTLEGAVTPPSGILGDCNQDTKVDAGDISAVILEIFDGDGTAPTEVPNGSFAGDVIGCNANQDAVVDAGDISCTVLTIFGQACGTGTRSVQVTVQPELTLAIEGSQVAVNLNPNGTKTSSLVFSLDYDESQATFDPTDADADGIPDAVRFNLPADFTGSVMVDLNDMDGELDFYIGDMALPLSALPNGILVMIDFTVMDDGELSNIVQFATEPNPSFSDISGRSMTAVNETKSTIYLPIIMR